MNFMASPKKKRKRARDKGDVVPLGVEISAAHQAALDSCIVQEQRTKRVIVERALEAYFTVAGLWPPPDAKPAKP